MNAEPIYPIIGYKNNIPIISTIERQDIPGGQEFYCRYCQTIHHHGQTDGHRIAHCFGDTPYCETGYYIKLETLYTPVKKGYANYNRNPTITIKNHITYAYITLDMQPDKYLNSEGEKVIDSFFNDLRQNLRIHSIYGVGRSNAGITVKRNCARHVAEFFKHIAFNPQYAEKGR
ncbi:MAG: hypothetical protein WC556_05215 [Candidatus Methanoperedens sp.]